MRNRPSRSPWATPPASARRSSSSRSPTRACANGASRSCSATCACCATRPSGRDARALHGGRARAARRRERRSVAGHRLRRTSTVEALQMGVIAPALGAAAVHYTREAARLALDGKHRRHRVGAAQQGGDARRRLPLRGRDRDLRRDGGREALRDGAAARRHAPHAAHQPHGAARGVRQGHQGARPREDHARPRGAGGAGYCGAAYRGLGAQSRTPARAVSSDARRSRRSSRRSRRPAPRA